MADKRCLPGTISTHSNKERVVCTPGAGSTCACILLLHWDMCVSAWPMRSHFQEGRPGSFGAARNHEMYFDPENRITDSKPRPSARHLRPCTCTQRASVTRAPTANAPTLLTNQPTPPATTPVVCVYSTWIHLHPHQLPSTGIYKYP